LREIETEFEHAGIAVRFVVIGTPEVANEFCARFGELSHCMADPEKRTYAAMGLEEYSLWRLPFDRALRARRNENKAAGFRQNWRATRMENAAQLPGAAFFDGDGILRWVYRGKHPGDLPPMREMFERVRSVRP
jgi:alkyl-hydroperoxide reductase/thiol specific antioxidant family protein